MCPGSSAASAATFSLSLSDLNSGHRVQRRSRLLQLLLGAESLGGHRTFPIALLNVPERVPRALQRHARRDCVS